MEKSTPTTTCGTLSRVGSACAIWGPPCVKRWFVRTSATVRRRWPLRASVAPCAWPQGQHRLPAPTPQQVNVNPTVEGSGCTAGSIRPVSVLCCSCWWTERWKLHSGGGGLPTQRHLETRALSRVRLWQRRRHLRWGPVWTAVRLWEGGHAWGRVLPRVRQLRQRQQDDRWDEFIGLHTSDLEDIWCWNINVTY